MPWLSACFWIRIINLSNIALDISYDGVTVHDYIRADSDFFLMTQTNAQPNAFEALMAKGTIIYVSSAAAGIGRIILSAYYV